MKVVKNEKAFEPVSITLTFETKKELDDFGSLSNYCAVTEAAPVFSQIWPIMKAAGADIYGQEVRDELNKRAARSLRN